MSSPSAAPSSATESPAAATSSQVVDSFVPVRGESESVDATALLVAAYGLMWLLVFGFVVLALRRQRHLNSRLTELETAIERAEARSSAGTSQGSRS